MSVLEEVLLEEYDRALRIKEGILNEQKSLPRGSVQRKVIGGREYYYLMYRDGDKVVSEYIRNSDVELYRQKIEKRRENNQSLKELDKSINQIIKALGKDVISEHTGK